MDMTTSTQHDQRFLASTHEVTNVSRELVDYNLYREDRALMEAVRREGAAWADDALAQFARDGGLQVIKVDPVRADSVARLGWSKLVEKKTVSPEDLDANYIRRSDAEIFFKAPNS